MRACFHAGLALLFASVFCAAEAAPAQAPGYFRYALGGFTVTALYDGSLNIPLSAYQGAGQERMHGLAAEQFLDQPAGVPTSVNAYLIDTGSHRILVDTGTAACFGPDPDLGHVPENLRAAGYAPEDIDIVLITHLHGDHFCGLKRGDGKRAYPNAAVWVAQAEAAYWLDEKIAAAKPENQQGAFEQAREVMGLYRAAGRLHLFTPGETIVPGLGIVPAPGHTPGHTAFLFESQGRSLLVFGDIVHCYAVQFPLPAVWVVSDIDPKQAVATREALFARLARDGTAIAGAHLPFPGIGHIRREGEGYAYVPVEYGPLAK